MFKSTAYTVQFANTVAAGAFAPRKNESVTAQYQLEQYSKFFNVYDFKNKAFSPDIQFQINGEPVCYLPFIEKYVTRKGVERLYVKPEVGKGSSKKACMFGSEEYICLLPNTDVKGSINTISQKWESTIQAEKAISDEIAKLGIRTQCFTIDTLSIRDPKTMQWYSIKVLKAKNFNALAKEEHICIIDRKNGPYGAEINFFNGDKNNMANSHWNKCLFQDLINEITIGLTFKVPVAHGDACSLYVCSAPSLDAAPSFHLFMFDFVNTGEMQKFSYLKQTPHIPSKDDVLLKFKIILEDICWFMPKSEKAQLGTFAPDVNGMLNFLEKDGLFHQMYEAAVLHVQNYLSNTEAPSASFKYVK